MIKKRNILIGVTAIALILSTGVAFAASDPTDVPARKGPGLMANLTDEQRGAVMQARSESMQEAISELAKEGTITPDTAAKLSEMAVPKEGKLCELTEEERTALHKAEAAEFENQLAALVDDGTITQEQADQMVPGQKMMRGLNLTDEQREAVMAARINAVKSAAAALVEAGTLTQDLANDIAAMLDIKKGEKPAALLSDEQRTALGEAMKEKLENKLSELVSDGTLTQDQADRLLNDAGAMRMGPGGKHGYGPGPLKVRGTCNVPTADEI